MLTDAETADIPPLLFPKLELKAPRPRSIDHVGDFVVRIQSASPPAQSAPPISPAQSVDGSLLSPHTSVHKRKPPRRPASAPPSTVNFEEQFETAGPKSAPLARLPVDILPPPPPLCTSAARDIRSTWTLKLFS